MNEKEYDELKRGIESFTGKEKFWFRFLVKKNCLIKGKRLSDDRIIKILQCDKIITMTIINDLDNNFDNLIKFVKITKDHAQWSIDELYKYQQEVKEEVEIREEEHNRKLNEIKDKIKILTKIELLFLRDLIKNYYQIFAMGYSIKMIMYTIDLVGGSIEEINEFLEIVHDHSKWEEYEAEYKKEIEDGFYDKLFEEGE
jgi:polyhydroxyalkanoate synthesis regulator phasin